ncbi:hypothetical protein B0H12DRAFT_1127182 [Mycena haematopus]|nr:hypothetical protein B0H12DRAFT_1127182 [Mycena haematopus]
MAELAPILPAVPDVLAGASSCQVKNIFLMQGLGGVPRLKPLKVVATKLRDFLHRPPAATTVMNNGIVPFASL